MCRIPLALRGSICRECMCGPSTRWRTPARACTLGGSLRRPTAGTAVIATPLPPRSSASAPRSSGLRTRRAAGLPGCRQALGLLAQPPPSAEHAKASLAYAGFLRAAQEQTEDQGLALHRALEIAEAAGATTVIPRVLGSLAHHGLLRGHVEEGLAFLQRGQALAQASRYGRALVYLAIVDSDVQLKLAKFHKAAESAVRGLDVADQVGLADSVGGTVLAANAAEALVALGRTGEAATLIDPLTPGPPDRDHWVLHAMRAEIDLLRGHTEAAGRRQQLLRVVTAHIGIEDAAWETAQQAAELALWAGRTGDALAEVQQALPLFQAPDPAIMCGRLLGAGMWACADLAEQARRRRDDRASAAAVDAAGWAGLVGGPNEGCPVHRRSAGGRHPGPAGHLGGRAHPAGRGE
jgi:hypothetical protein